MREQAPPLDEERLRPGKKHCPAGIGALRRQDEAGLRKILRPPHNPDFPPYLPSASGDAAESPPSGGTSLPSSFCGRASLRHRKHILRTELPVEVHPRGSGLFPILRKLLLPPGDTLLPVQGVLSLPVDPGENLRLREKEDIPLLWNQAIPCEVFPDPEKDSPDNRIDVGPAKTKALPVSDKVFCEAKEQIDAQPHSPHAFGKIPLSPSCHPPLFLMSFAAFSDPPALPSLALPALFPPKLLLQSGKEWFRVLQKGERLEL